jgi:PAS domain S-box-containing protein
VRRSLPRRSYRSVVNIQDTGSRTDRTEEHGSGGRFAALFHSVPDAVLVVNVDGRLVELNRRAEEMFGYARREMVGETVEMLLPKRLRAAHQHHRMKYSAQPAVRLMGAGTGFVGCRRDNTEFFADVSLSPVDGPDGEVVAIVRDVTAWVESAGKSDYLTAIVESSPDAIYGEDRNGLVTSWSRGAEELFGYPASEVFGWRSARLIAEDRWDEHEVVLRRALAGDVHDHVDTEIRRRDGVVVPVVLTVSPIRDGRGQVTGACVIARDVTEQRLVLAALEESATTLREDESLARMGGWVLDAGTGAVQWSAELHRIHGLDPIEFGGTIDAHLAQVLDDDRDRVRRALDAALEQADNVDLLYRVARPDGETVWLHCRAAPVHVDGRVVGLRGICQEVPDPHVGWAPPSHSLAADSVIGSSS